MGFTIRQAFSCVPRLARSLARPSGWKDLYIYPTIVWGKIMFSMVNWVVVWSTFLGKATDYIQQLAGL